MAKHIGIRRRRPASAIRAVPWSRCPRRRNPVRVRSGSATVRRPR